MQTSSAITDNLHFSIELSLYQVACVGPLGYYAEKYGILDS